jgi:hypothetical protein
VDEQAAAAGGTYRWDGHPLSLCGDGVGGRWDGAGAAAASPSTVAHICAGMGKIDALAYVRVCDLWKGKKVLLKICLTKIATGGNRTPSFFLSTILLVEITK